MAPPGMTRFSLLSYNDSDYHSSDTKAPCFTPRSLKIIQKNGLVETDLSSETLLNQKFLADVALKHLPQNQKQKLRDFYKNQVERQLSMLKEQYEEALEKGFSAAPSPTFNGRDSLSSTTHSFSSSKRKSNDQIRSLSPPLRNGHAPSPTHHDRTSLSPQRPMPQLSELEQQKLTQLEQQKQEHLERVLIEEAKRRESKLNRAKKLQANRQNRLKRRREKQDRVQSFREKKQQLNRLRRSEAQEEFQQQQKYVEDSLVKRLKRHEKRRQLRNREKELTIQMQNEKNEEKLRQIREQHAQVQEELRQKAHKDREKLNQIARKHEEKLRNLQESLKSQNEQKSEDIQRQINEARARKRRQQEEKINVALNRMEKAEENQKHLKKQLDEQLKERKRSFELREIQRLRNLKRQEEQDQNKLNRLMRQHDQRHEDYLARKNARDQRLRERNLELSLLAEKKKTEAEKRRRCEHFQLQQRLNHTQNKIQEIDMRNKRRMEMALLNKRLDNQSASEMHRLREYVASLKENSSINPPDWIDEEQLRQLIEKRGLNIQIQKKALIHTPKIDSQTYERLMGNFMKRETRQVKMAFGRPISPENPKGTPILGDPETCVAKQRQISHLQSEKDVYKPLEEGVKSKDLPAPSRSTSPSKQRALLTSRRTAEVNSLKIPRVSPRKRSRKRKQQPRMRSQKRNATNLSTTLPERGTNYNEDANRLSRSMDGKAYNALQKQIPSHVDSVMQESKNSFKYSPYAQNLKLMLSPKKRTKGKRAPGHGDGLSARQDGKQNGEDISISEVEDNTKTTKEEQNDSNDESLLQESKRETQDFSIGGDSMNLNDTLLNKELENQSMESPEKTREGTLTDTFGFDQEENDFNFTQEQDAKEEGDEEENNGSDSKEEATDDQLTTAAPSIYTSQPTTNPPPDQSPADESSDVKQIGISDKNDILAEFGFDEDDAELADLMDDEDDASEEEDDGTDYDMDDSLLQSPDKKHD